MTQVVIAGRLVRCNRSLGRPKSSGKKAVCSVPLRLGAASAGNVRAGSASRSDSDIGRLTTPAPDTARAFAESVTGLPGKFPAHSKCRSRYIAHLRVVCPGPGGAGG